MEADRVVAEAVRVVAEGEWVEVAKAAVVVDVRVVVAVAVVDAVWVVEEDPAVAAVAVPAAVVAAARAAVGKAAAAVVDGRAAVVGPVADPAVAVVVGRDRAVSKL